MADDAQSQGGPDSAIPDMAISDMATGDMTTEDMTTRDMTTKDMTTVDMTPVAVVAAACTTDNVAGLGASGMTMLPGVGDFVPLCSGWMVIADQVANQLAVVDATTGAHADTFPLTAAPSELALDAEHGRLHAHLTGLTRLASLDTVTGMVSYVPLTQEPQGLAVGNGGLLFAGGSPILIIDGVAGTQLSKYTPAMGGLPLLAYDHADDLLIGGTRGGSPASLYRFAFDPVNKSLTASGSLWNAGGNGEQLTLSPDGKHVAYTCGGGNNHGYAIDDFHTNDFTMTDGTWVTGPYPTASAFSQDGKFIASTNGFNSGNLFVFSTANHALLQTYQVKAACSWDPYASVRVGFSRGGKLVYLMANCWGANLGHPTAGFVAWFKLP